MSKAKISSLSGATRKAGRSVFLSSPRSSSNLVWTSSSRLVRQALAAAKATNRIPIVFVGGGDPVAMGLVKSLARPGGNLTGLTFVTVELASKRMQLLKDAVPIAKRVAVLWNPNNVISKLELEKATTTAEALGLTPLPIEIRVLDDIEG